LLGERLAFTDRPSVFFGDSGSQWGTVGAQSPFRAYEKSFEDKPVKIKVFDPLSGLASQVYSKYLEADIVNTLFRKTVLDGLATDPSFQSKLMDVKGKYHNNVTGGEILTALLADRDRLLTSPLEEDNHPEFMFTTDSQQGRDKTFRVLLASASINLTSTMYVAEQINCIPVSDDIYTTRLLAMRCSDSTYMGNKQVLTTALALEVLQSVIPEQALAEMSFGQIIEYRDASKEAYKGWLTEIESLSTKLSNIDIPNVDEAIKDIYRSDVAPKIIEYKREMESVRDKLFGELMKKVIKWQFPTLMLSHLTGIGYFNAITTFALSFSFVVPPLVNSIVSTRDVIRKNSFSYLIGLAAKAKHK
jgi:hypothetical protein